jgi:hypothetical protein
MTRHNPFATYASVATGDEFFGRQPELDKIRSRWLDGSEPGNMPVVGMPRVGKSSLVRQAVRLFQPELTARRIVVADLSLGMCRTARQFFHGLVRAAHNRIQDAGWASRPTRDQFGVVCGAVAGDEMHFNQEMFEFFYRVRQDGVRVILFVDEFDSIRTVFQEVDEFQVLRELGQNPDRRVALITASRRPIEVLERNGHSTLAAAMGQVLYLTPFTGAEAEGFYTRCAGAGLELGADHRAAIERTTGYQPYLLCMLGNNLVWEWQQKGTAEIGAICAETGDEFVAHYREIVRVLEDAELWSALMQILFGPVYSVTREHVQSLLKYQLIRAHGDGYRAFSEHLQEYLRIQARNIEYWPLWRDTEIALRDLLNTFLSGKYGPDWADAPTGPLPRVLRAKLDGWRQMQANEQRQFKVSASTSLLDYSFSLELFELMSIDWPWFQRVLGRRQTEWEQEFQLLNRLRAPAAHSRDLSAFTGHLERAKAICMDLQNRIAEWRAASPGSPP